MTVVAVARCLRPDPCITWLCHVAETVLYSNGEPDIPRPGYKDNHVNEESRLGVLFSPKNIFFGGGRRGGRVNFGQDVK